MVEAYWFCDPKCKGTYTRLQRMYNSSAIEVGGRENRLINWWLQLSSPVREESYSLFLL
jgi:hypothetical protein